MLAFRNWFVFFLPSVGIILDIRDGWSIAIKSGYGGTTKPNKPKALLASLFEKYAILRASLTITCTNGLKEYLDSLTSKKLQLITNGYSQDDYEIVKNFNNDLLDKNSNNTVKIGVCAGQFSEYGIEKVKRILIKINDKNEKTIIKLIGSNEEKNSWIKSWTVDNNLNNLKIEILPRMTREDMYKEILKADYGITVIRDPLYEFGTKVFDYILCNKPIFNYFDEDNNFTVFFDKQLLGSKIDNYNVDYLRESLIEKKKDSLLNSLK